MATILVAEDEAQVRSVLRLLFEAQGHRVCEAADGAEAVATFRRLRPDLVVTDLMMPVKGGITAITEIRELAPSVPVVAISGGARNGQFSMLAVARTFPGVRVIPKPFEVREMVSVVEELLASVPQGGDEFVVTRRQASSAAAPRAKGPPETLKTLIVEDDFVSRRLLQAILGPLGHCDVAVNGKEALTAFRLALAENAPYDLVCLDIMMPGMDGLQVLRELRRLEAERRVGGREGVKVVMVTALGDFDTIMGAFKDQCEAYLVKPVQRAKLLDTLRGLGLAA